VKIDWPPSELEDEKSEMRAEVDGVTVEVVQSPVGLWYAFYDDLMLCARASRSQAIKALEDHVAILPVK
jgi:hypothetical protein